MPAFRIDDPGFFEAVTSDSMQWYQSVLKEMDTNGARIVLGDDPWDLDNPGIGILSLPPGAVIQRHAHDYCVLFLVARGSLDLGDGTVLGPGDMDLHSRGEFYGPYTAGPDGVVTYEFMENNRHDDMVAEDGADPETLAYIERVHATQARARADAGLD